MEPLEEIEWNLLALKLKVQVTIQIEKSKLQKTNSNP